MNPLEYLIQALLQGKLGSHVYDLLNRDVRVGIKAHDDLSEQLYQMLLKENSPRGQAARIAGLMADKYGLFGGLLQLESGDEAKRMTKAAGAYFPALNYIALPYPDPQYSQYGLDPKDVLGHEIGHAIGSVDPRTGLGKHGYLPEYFERSSFSQPVHYSTPHQVETTKQDLSRLLQLLAGQY